MITFTNYIWQDMQCNDNSSVTNNTANIYFRQSREYAGDGDTMHVLSIMC